MGSPVKIFKTGEWDKVRERINAERIKRGVDAANKLAMRNVVAVGERMAVLFLRNQVLSWRPLADSTLRAKLNKNPQGSSKILIDTSSYLNNITSWVDGNGNGFIGVTKMSRNKDGDVIANIAIVMEYGSRSRNIPARPLWHPVKNKLIEFIKSKKPFVVEFKR